jgi:hypothetical protein
LFTFDRAISAAQDSSQTSWIIFVVTLVLLVSKFWLFKVGFFHTDVLIQGILTEGEGYILTSLDKLLFLFKILFVFLQNQLP